LMRVLASAKLEARVLRNWCNIVLAMPRIQARLVLREAPAQRRQFKTQVQELINEQYW
jgi:hypothetical protein